MPPRLPIPAGASRLLVPSNGQQYVCRQCRFASVAAVHAPGASTEQIRNPGTPMTLHAATQPPSHKRPEFRKTQLHRQYQSAIRSAPLMLLFQHNNLKAVEWSGIRRELATALRKVDQELAKDGDHTYLGDSVKLQIVQTGIFASAMKVVEFWNPQFDRSQDPNAAAPHGLSTAAWRKVQKSRRRRHGLEPLMSGPIATLTFPTVSPQHLKAALAILSPSPEFPAPRRKAVPSYHEPQVQTGLQKLMLLGARIDGQAFDMNGVKWVGGIAGGLDGLRAQLVALLGSVGAGITNTLDAAGRTLYITMESRKSQLEEESKEKEGGS